MSGGIAQLVAVGAQDAHLVGQPEVSFFRSNYRRHTNFAQTVERQVLQGIPTAGGISTVRFERKGDLLGYCYIANRNPNALNKSDWINRIQKVEWLVGGHRTYSNKLHKLCICIALLMSSGRKAR